MDKLKKIIKTVATWSVIIFLILGIISLFGGNAKKANPSLKKTVTEVRNAVGMPEKSSAPNIRIPAGKTATIEIPPLKWTSWIVCDGTYFRTAPSGLIKMVFTDGATIEDGPELITNIAEITDRMIFKAYNPSETDTVILKVSVK